MKRVLAVALGVAAFASASAASADAADACAAAHRTAQLERRDGHLLRARKSLLVCAQESCPTLLRRDCTDWLVGVDNMLPTVVVEPRDGAGVVVTEARAFVDDDATGAVLDGKAFPIDPGEHRVRVQAPGRADVETHAVIVEGAKAQRLAVVFGPKSVAPPVEPQHPGDERPKRSGSLVVTGALAAVGVTGVALFTGFGLAGRSVRSDLDDSGCRPQCDQGKVDEMWRNFTIADISLGIGVAALTAAVVHFVLTH